MDDLTAPDHVTRSALLAEIERLLESAEYTMVQHFIAAVWWSRAHYTLGLVGTLAGAAATALVASKDGTLISDPAITAAIAATGAVITAAITFLRPKDQADLHHGKGVAYEKLRTQARILKELDLPTKSAEDVRSKLVPLLDQKIQLNDRKPAAPSGIIYHIARRQIERGQTRYRTDTSA